MVKPKQQSLGVLVKKSGTLHLFKQKICRHSQVWVENFCTINGVYGGLLHLPGPF